MKFILASSFAPFINGGGRFIVEWLEEELRDRGHEVERFFLPFAEHSEILDQSLAYRMIDLSDACDRLVTFRPPAHVLRHPRKIVWFIHHIRGFYDLWHSKFRSVGHDTAGFALREALIDLDSNALREAYRVFSNSGVVAERLRRFNAIESVVLYPPLRKAENYCNLEYGNDIVAICRIEEHKRQHLLIEAMKYTKSKVRLRISGRSASPEYIERLRGLIEDSGASDRIFFEDRWISDEEKTEFIGRALAIAYLPLDEDSYGYPSLEAAHASKAVVTTHDSGGVNELVSDGVNGFVVDAAPSAVGAAFDRLYNDRKAAQRLGVSNRARISDLHINWDTVIEALTA